MALIFGFSLKIYSEIDRDWRVNQLIKIVFTKHKFAYRVTLFFPGVFNLHKHSIFFCVQLDPSFNILCVQKKNECVPGRYDALWIHLWIKYFAVNKINCRLKYVILLICSILVFLWIFSSNIFLIGQHGVLLYIIIIVYTCLYNYFLHIINLFIYARLKGEGVWNVVFILRLRKSLHLLGLQGLAKIQWELPSKQYNESIFLGPYSVHMNLSANVCK